jgi:hypothetical protein
VYVFLSRVLFFFFWLGLPYLGLLGVLILSPQQLTATPEAAAVSTRVLNNQHACFIVSSSSRLRPSLLFSSLLFHLALALTVSLSLSPSLAPPPSRARARELRPLGKRSDASPDEGLVLANSYKELFFNNNNNK